MRLALPAWLSIEHSNGRDGWVGGGGGGVTVVISAFSTSCICTLKKND